MSNKFTQYINQFLQSTRRPVLCFGYSNIIMKRLRGVGYFVGCGSRYDIFKLLNYDIVRELKHYYKNY